MCYRPGHCDNPLRTPPYWVPSRVWTDTNFNVFSLTQAAIEPGNCRSAVFLHSLRTKYTEIFGLLILIFAVLCCMTKHLLEISCEKWNWCEKGVQFIILSRLLILVLVGFPSWTHYRRRKCISERSSQRRTVGCTTGDLILLWNRPLPNRYF